MAARDDLTAGPRPPLADRLSSGQWLGIDCVVAVLAAVTLLIGAARVRPGHSHAPIALAVPFVLAVTLPVAVRRIWPIPVLVVVTGASCVLTAYGRAPAVMDVTLCMAVYTAAVTHRRTAALAVLATVELSLGIAVWRARPASGCRWTGCTALLAAAAFCLIGDTVRERHKYLAGLAEQEAQRQRAEAERSRQALARSASGLPASCTTWWRTASAWSPCRPGSAAGSAWLNPARRCGRSVRSR